MTEPMTEPMSEPASSTAWNRGRLDGRRGRRQVLFGRMYEDAAIEMAAFPAGGRVFCIASAGCTAMRLAQDHDVTAVDINPVQIAYAERRLAGGPMVRGTAERIMAIGRALAPLCGWWPGRMRQFLELDDPGQQLDYWRRHLDTRRFRAGFDGLLSMIALRAVYAPGLLAFVPRHLGAVLRRRMDRCFLHHANRTNPYARALLCGELDPGEPLPRSGSVRLVAADAADYLEAQPAGSIDGFSLSNILDGANAAYRQRLLTAVRRAAAPGAMAVVRSFGEPPSRLATNRAAADRSMLWGIVDVGPVSASVLGEAKA